MPKKKCGEQVGAVLTDESERYKLIPNDLHADISEKHDAYNFLFETSHGCYDSSANLVILRKQGKANHATLGLIDKLVKIYHVHFPAQAQKSSVIIPQLNVKFKRSVWHVSDANI